MAAVEAVSETALLFYGLILSPPEISFFLMNGMVLFPAVINLIIHLGRSHQCSNACTCLLHWSSRKGYVTISERQPSTSSILKTVVQILGVLFQFVGIVFACVFVGLDVKKTAAWKLC